MGEHAATATRGEGIEAQAGISIHIHTYRGLEVESAVMEPLCPAMDKAGGGMRKAERGVRRRRRQARRRGRV